MSVLGRVLIGSGERLDLSDFKSIDSFVAGDFKYFLQGLIGKDKPYILRGFDIIDPVAAIGAQTCSIRVADSVVFYPTSGAGPFYHGLEEGNPNALPLVPELRKNAVNYVYLTFSTFETATDTRAFWDPDRDSTGGEFTQDVNTESILKCEVGVSVGSFPLNSIPVAKITVGPITITAIEDCRDLMFRLGSGGANPNPLNKYAWRSLPSSQYQRSEPSSTLTAGGVNPFQGADKNIYSLKEWMDVVMTKLKELGGTTYWYDDTSTFNIINFFVDALATTMKSKGKWLHDASTPGQLTWTEDLHITGVADNRTYIIRNGTVSLDNEQVAYLNLNRRGDFSAANEPVAWINGSNIVNTSTGAVGQFANLTKGDWIKKVEDPIQYFVRVEELYSDVNLGGSTTTGATAKSVRLSTPYQGGSGVAVGLYDKGVYAAGEVVVSDRDDIAINNAGANYHWLAVRSDTIENISNIAVTTLTLDITEHDDFTARCVSSSAHNLIDGDYIEIVGSTNYDGIYKVDVVDSDEFYIQISGGPFGDESGVSAFYAVVTTAARTNGYGLQLESANHCFATDDKIEISDTTNFDGSYSISVRSATSFNIAVDGAYSTETAGTATLAKIIVRAENGIFNIIQGEDIDIGGSFAGNLKQFLGMTSDSQTYPDYQTPPSYNTLNGFANYNGLSSDNVTARLSKLTAMMADKAQDKTIKYLAQGVDNVVNTTNGPAQELTFPSGSTLTILKPGSTGNAVITLPSSAPGISLLVNQSAYVTIDRNAGSTPTISVAATASIPVDENVFVIASRTTGSTCYIWDGREVVVDLPFPQIIASQNLNHRLIKGGTWGWDLGTTTLTWSDDAFVQVPGLSSDRNTISAASNTALTANGMCLWVALNRTAGSSATLTVNASTIESVPTDPYTYIFARREDDKVIIGEGDINLYVLANPMTSQGDIIVGGVGGAPSALPKGNANEVLKTNAGSTGIEYGLLGVENVGSRIEVAFTNPGDFSTDTVIRGIPQFPWASPQLLPPPATLPTGGSGGTAWSPNGEFLVTGEANSPYIHIYQRSGTTFTKLANPSTLPNGPIRDAAWSPNGEFLAVAHDSSPRITIYQRSGTTFTNVTNPGALPPDTAHGVSWSPNGEFLAVAHLSSPYITIYQRSGTTFTKLANPGTLPGGYGTSVSWSPNGEFLAMTTGTAAPTSLIIYQRSGTTFTKLPDPSSPPSSATSCEWSPNGKFLAVTSGASPYIHLYTISGTTLTKLPDPTSLPNAGCGELSWSASSGLLALGGSGSTRIHVYSVSGTTFTKLADPSSLPTGTCQGVAWSPNGEFLSVTTLNAHPYILTYQTTQDMPDMGVLWVRGIKRSGA